jgi:hypothetical protein
MEETYELNVRNILIVLEQQLATSEFDGNFDYIPYQEFDPQGDRVWSNLMSGQWAYQQAVCVSFVVLIPRHLLTNVMFRTISRRIGATMVRCWFQS